MRLWDFTVSAYARPDMEAVCLELQDAHGQCVPLLLWRLWAIGEGWSIGLGVLRRAAQIARAWDRAAIGPLRDLRRALTAPDNPLSTPGLPALREQIKACELAAERQLLEVLEAMTPASHGVSPRPLNALKALVDAWGSPAPKTLLGRLLRASS